MLCCTSSLPAPAPPEGSQQSTNVGLLLCNPHTCRVQTLTDRQLRQRINRMSNVDKLLSLAKVLFCAFLGSRLVHSSRFNALAF